MAAESTSTVPPTQYHAMFYRTVSHQIVSWLAQALYMFFVERRQTVGSRDKLSNVNNSIREITKRINKLCPHRHDNSRYSTQSAT